MGNSNNAVDGTVLSTYGFGSNSQSGIYTFDCGMGLQKLVDENTLIPDSGLPLTSIRTASRDDGRTVFLSNTIPGQTAIFEEFEGTFRTVANHTTPIPEGSGTFDGPDGFIHPIVDDGHFVFMSFDLSLAIRGIYTDLDGQLSKVRSPNDTLFEKTISSLTWELENLSANAINFYAEFTGGSSGFFLATPTAPGPEVVPVDKDSYLRQGNPNRNEGTNPRLRVRAAGNNRAVVAFDLSGIDPGTVTSASLVSTVA